MLWRNNIMEFTLINKDTASIISPTNIVQQTDDEIIVPVMGIDFHYMPQNGFVTDFNHRFGFQVALFTDSCAVASGKNYYFHFLTI